MRSSLQGRYAHAKSYVQTKMANVHQSLVSIFKYVEQEIELQEVNKQLE